jgi:hypothetical protein
MSDGGTTWEVTKNGEGFRFTLNTDTGETPTIGFFDIHSESREFVLSGELPVGASVEVEAVGEFDNE